MKLHPIDWPQVGKVVYLRHWEDVARANSECYGALTVDQMPAGRKAYITLGGRLVGKEEVNIDAEERIERAIQVMTAGLGVALVRAGWDVHTSRGMPSSS